MKKTKPEKQIQTECLNYLDSLEKQGKLYYYRSQSGAVSTIRQDGSKGYMKTGRAGCPDISVCLKINLDDMTLGLFCAIEVKSLKGTLSPAQKQTSQIINELGGKYLLVHSVQELQQDLKSLLDGFK